MNNLIDYLPTVPGKPVDLDAVRKLAEWMRDYAREHPIEIIIAKAPTQPEPPAEETR